VKNLSVRRWMRTGMGSEMVTDDSETSTLDNFESEVGGGACFKPMVFICITWFNPENSVHYPQVVFLHFVWFSE
jgi:hypothetical protein